MTDNAGTTGEPATLDDGASSTEYVARARSDAMRGSLWTALATIIGLPVTFAANVVMAHVLDPTGLGEFATYVVTFAVIVALGNLGWSEATVQWLAGAGARGSRSDAVDLIRRCTGFHLLISGPVAAIGAFALVMNTSVSLALLAAAVVWVWQAVSTSTVILTAGARNARSAQIALVVNTSTQLAVVTTAVTTRAPASTWTVLLAFTLLGPTIALTALRPWERQALLRPRFSFLSTPSGFFTYAVSACAAGIVATLVFGRSEIFVLRANGLLEEVGVFAVVTALASQLTAPLDSLMAPLTPIAAGIYAIDHQRARRAFRRALRVSAAIATVDAIVLVPIGVVAIEPIYGEEFASGVLPFLVLGLISCLQTALVPVSSFAFATRSASQVLRANLVCLTLDAALAISLVPLIGLAGAVIASSGAQIASLYLISLVVSRRLGVPLTAMAGDTRLFALGLAVGIAVGLACAGLNESTRLLSIPAIFFGIAVVWVGMRLFPALRLASDDIEFASRGGSNRPLSLLGNWLRRAGVVRSTE